HDHRAGLQQPPRLGVTDHVQPRPVLGRGQRIEALQLGQQAAAGGEPLQPEQGGMPDKLGQGVGNAHRRSLRLFFCSNARRRPPHKGRLGGTAAGPKTVEKPSVRESRAELLRPQPQESNENPSFPATYASEMTLLMAEGVTISQEIEPIPPCRLSRKSGKATFSTH